MITTVFASPFGPTFGDVMDPQWDDGGNYIVDGPDFVVDGVDYIKDGVE